MSFKSYACETTREGLFVLTDPQPLVFSGRHGLVAKFVLSEKDRAGRPWKLCPGEIHALAFPERLIHDRMIVFEEVEDSERSLLWLQRISGISTAKTEMMFSFSPLTTVCPDPLRARRQTVDCAYGEDLVLDGGVLNPNGSWRWKKPHLALGGIVLGRGGRASSCASSVVR